MAQDQRPDRTIANILLHMGQDPQHQARLEVALALARRFQAHLEIAYVLAPAGMPAEIQGRGASAAYIAERTAIARERQHLVEAEIVARCTEAGVPFTWEVLDSDHNKPLADRSLFADILVVNRDFGIDEEQVSVEDLSALITAACCPVLILPRGHAPDTPLGRTVLIAWKDSREASHAVRRARPFLRTADRVVLLTVESSDAKSDRDIVGYLHRHGIEVEARHDARGGDPAKAILLQAEVAGADLLVTGAYGRSRWLELLAHGVTHNLVAQARLPILLSH